MRGACCSPECDCALSAACCLQGRCAPSPSTCCVATAERDLLRPHVHDRGAGGPSPTRKHQGQWPTQGLRLDGSRQHGYFLCFSAKWMVISMCMYRRAPHSLSITITCYNDHLTTPIDEMPKPVHSSQNVSLNFLVHAWCVCLTLPPPPLGACMCGAGGVHREPRVAYVRAGGCGGVQRPGAWAGGQGSSNEPIYVYNGNTRHHHRVFGSSMAPPYILNDGPPMPFSTLPPLRRPYACSTGAGDPGQHVGGALLPALHHRQGRRIHSGALTDLRGPLPMYTHE